MPDPSLTRLDAPGTPRGLVLMLHGGKECSTLLVDGRSASWRRSGSMQRAIAPGLHEAGVSCWLLAYRHRGWNGGAAPIQDARWALAQACNRFRDVPVVLLGHSMGARVAVHVADEPAVVGVVGLAPWWPRGEPVAALRGKPLHAAHGRTDKITSYQQSRAYVERAAAVASAADLRDMGRVGHYMFRRVPAWNDFALTTSLQLLV